MTEPAPQITSDWRRLSPWAVVHFSARAIIQNVQAFIFAGPAAYGASRWGADELAWVIPTAILTLVIVGACLAVIFYGYRVLDDAVQVSRGALFRKHVNLSFERVQNVSIEHPFYFRPIARVTLRIDGAGSKGEEVNIAALTIPQAEALRSYILRRRETPDLEMALPAATAPSPAVPGSTGEVFFTRSPADLVIHGLTNNRSFIAIAGLATLLWQSGLSPARIVERLGIDFDVVIGGLSLVRLALLFVLSLLFVIGIIAALSVIVSIVTYYGFTMRRTAEGLTVERGLLTRHEINVRKSRIQTVTLRQDWLDRLMGRRNIILERISHSQNAQDPSSQLRKRIFVPSVREAETAVVTDEVLGRCDVDALPFTPVHRRYFYKRTAIVSALYVLALIFARTQIENLNWPTVILLAAWPLHVLYAYLSWRRGGLAVAGELIVARSGAIGIDYRIFPAYKAQDVTHIQSLLMRRHALSSVSFHTASATISVPYMPTAFIRSVIDYCLFRVESTQRSWM